MTAVKHLFFDLDRTLWDFEANSMKALQIIFDEYNLKDSIAHFRHFHHTYVRANAELWKLYGKGGISKDGLRDERFRKTLIHHEIENEELVKEISNAYIEISPRQTLLFPGTLETLEELKELKYDMHIITNGFREVQHIKLENSGLRPYFREIICSETVGVAKPDKRVFNYAMELAGAKPEESVMIGDDREVDILGGNGAGMRTILFDNESQYPKAEGEYKVQNLRELPLLLTMI